MFLEKKVCRAFKTFSIANICTALNLFFSSLSVKGKQKGNILQIHECQCKIKMSQLSSQSVCQSQKCFKVRERTTWPGNRYSARSFWGEQFSDWAAAFRRGQAGFPSPAYLPVQAEVHFYSICSFSHEWSRGVRKVHWQLLLGPVYNFF